MSLYGKKWLIDGLPAGIIMRSIPANGRYTVVFEREFASLEQIEAVNWDKPTVEYIGPHGSEDGLPEGYGFEVEDIRYRSSTKSFDVILKTASQYLGDVTGYQDQIDQLEAASAEKDDTISTQATQIQEQQETISEQTAALQEKEATITEQTAALQEKEGTITEQTAALQEKEATITEQAATIQELEASGTAETLKADLQAAYEEGVESNG